MIRLGTALKSTEYPYHRCIVLSNPEANGGQVVRQWLADEAKIP